MTNKVNQNEVFDTKVTAEKEAFSTGMHRCSDSGKADYDRVHDGPMYDRWAELLTRGFQVYGDVEPGVPNWTLAETREEYLRFRKSWMRHSRQQRNGDRDEDHAAAIFFNINGMEYTRARLMESDPEGTLLWLSKLYPNAKTE